MSDATTLRAVGHLVLGHDATGGLVFVVVAELPGGVRVEIPCPVSRAELVELHRIVELHLYPPTGRI